MAKVAAKQLRALPRAAQVRINQARRRLQTDPSRTGTVVLQGTRRTFRRARVGDYRVVYTTLDDRLIILVVAVGQRKDVYAD